MNGDTPASLMKTFVRCRALQIVGRNCRSLSISCRPRTKVWQRQGTRASRIWIGHCAFGVARLGEGATQLRRTVRYTRCMRALWLVLGLLLMTLTACSSNVAGPGESCGGNISNARTCPAGYTCVSSDGEAPDLPGTCQKND